MDSEQVVTATVAGVAAVAAAVLGAPRVFRDSKDDILKQIQVHDALPESSPARKTLLDSIERQVEALAKTGGPRRDPVGIGLGVAFLVLAVLGGWSVARWGGGWWWASPIVVFLALLGIVGLAQDGPKRARDSKGRPA